MGTFKKGNICFGRGTGKETLAVEAAFETRRRFAGGELEFVGYIARDLQGLDGDGGIRRGGIGGGAFFIGGAAVIAGTTSGRLAQGLRTNQGRSGEAEPAVGLDGDGKNHHPQEDHPERPQFSYFHSPSFQE